MTEPELREGRPPLSFALGFRDDAEARTCTRQPRCTRAATRLAAAELFARHDSLEAKVGAAFAAWPEGTLDRLEQLAKLYPEVAVVQLHLGLARLWANEGDPDEAWRAAIEAEPDTPYAIVAGNLLHPQLPARAPCVHPVVRSAPAEITRLPPARQLEALRRRAQSGGVREQPPLRRRAAARRSAGLRVACLRRRRRSGIRAMSRRRSPAPSGSSTRTSPSGRSGASVRSSHVPRRADRPLPPRRPPALDGTDPGCRAPVPARARSRIPARRSRSEAARYLETIRRARS